jgi:hypothetical protein
MRIFLPIALVFAVAACSTPTRWEKPGISEETKEADLTVCKRAAAKQGLMYYPSAVNPPAGWAYEQPWGIMDTYRDDYRYHADFRLTDACMRYKGYDKVPVN